MELTKELLEMLARLPTGNVADNNPNGGVMDTEIKPVNPSLHLIGRAFTVKCHPGDNLAMHEGIYAAKPGEVLVLDCGGYSSAGHFGDIMATACKLRGLAGVVINGSCRDSQDIYKLEYPVYARGYNPSGTVKESLAQLDVPVVVGNVLVRPGDVIFADCDGVVVVPREDENEVFEKAIAKYNKEQEILKKLAEGRTTLEIYGFDKLIASKKAI